MMKDRIKQIRKDLKLNQTDFAEALGLSRNHIAQVETGKGKFSERTVRDICRIWNIDEEWLKTGNGEMYISQDEQISELFADVIRGDDPFLKAFLETWLSLDDTSRAALKTIAITMGEKLKERE